MEISEFRIPNSTSAYLTEIWMSLTSKSGVGGGGELFEEIHLGTASGTTLQKREHFDSAP